MIRSCPDHLEFKNECYSSVNQSISKKTLIFALILWEDQRLNHFRSEKKGAPKKSAETLLSILAPKKCPPVFFLTHTSWWCENITVSPCAPNMQNILESTCTDETNIDWLVQQIVYCLVKVVTRARVRFQKPGPKFVFSLLHLY